MTRLRIGDRSGEGPGDVVTLAQMEAWKDWRGRNADLEVQDESGKWTSVGFLFPVSPIDMSRTPWRWVRFQRFGRTEGTGRARSAADAITKLGGNPADVEGS